MTSEEREKMDALCSQIQQEKNYETFEELTRQLSELVARKERRFPERKFLVPNLFSEIRIQNSLVDAHGNELALKTGDFLDVRLEADAATLVRKAITSS